MPKYTVRATRRIVRHERAEVSVEATTLALARDTVEAAVKADSTLAGQDKPMSELFKPFREIETGTPEIEVTPVMGEAGMTRDIAPAPTALQEGDPAFQHNPPPENDVPVAGQGVSYDPAKDPMRMVDRTAFPSVGSGPRPPTPADVLNGPMIDQDHVGETPASREESKLPLPDPTQPVPAQVSGLDNTQVPAQGLQKGDTVQGAAAGQAAGDNSDNTNAATDNSTGSGNNAGDLKAIDDKAAAEKSAEDAKKAADAKGQQLEGDGTKPTTTA